MKFMCITNEVQMAKIADSCGVDYVFIDLEIIGKELRQGHLDTVISRHHIDDIKKIKPFLNESKLLVRVNPIHSSTKKEVDLAINYGADALMLPFFHTKSEVEKFIDYVDGRCSVFLLLETKESFECIDEILELKDNIHAIHIGLNDLHLSLNMKFMFEPFISGHVTILVDKFNKHGVDFGIGGVAELGKGDIPAELVLNEHAKLGSKYVILSRSFTNNDSSANYDDLFIKEYENKFSKLKRFCIEIDPDLVDENSLRFESLIKERAGIEQ